MKRLYLKYLLDIVMTILFLLLMNTLVTGLRAHEVLGLVLIGLFFLHKLLNLRWIKAVFFALKHHCFRGKSRVSLIISVLLLLTILLIGVSGVLIAKELFVIDIDQRRVWVSLHHISAYLGLILVAIHLGMHWNSIINTLRKLFGLRSGNTVRKIILRLIAVMLMIYGVYALATNDMSGMLQKDFEKIIDGGGRGYGNGNGKHNSGIGEEEDGDISSIYDLAKDYGTVMVLFIGGTYYTLRLIQNKK